MRPNCLPVQQGYKTRNPMFWWYWYNTLRKNCVLYMPMIYNNAAHTELKDWSGTGNNGTIHGATKVTAPFNQAMSFNGIDDYVDCGSAQADLSSSPATISMWVKATYSSLKIMLIDGKSNLGLGFYTVDSNQGLIVVAGEGGNPKPTMLIPDWDNNN